MLGIICAGGLGCGSEPGKPQPDDPPDPVPLRLIGAGAFADTLGWLGSTAGDFAQYRLLRAPARSNGDPDATAARLLLTIDDPQTVVTADTTVSPHQSYHYWLEVIDRAGQAGVSGPLAVSTPGLAEFGVGLTPRWLVAAPGDTVSIEVWVESAPEVFGTAIDLGWPPSIEILSCQPSSFFGDGALSICQTQEGGLGLAITLVQGAPPVAGFGPLAQIRARVKVAGIHSLGFISPPRFVDSAGQPLAAIPRLWAATVRVGSAP